MRHFFLITGLLCSVQSFSFVSLGTMVPNFAGSQADEDGSPTLLRVNPFISFDYNFDNLFWGQSFNPEIGYVFHTDAEDGTSHNTLFLLYNLEHTYSNSVRLRYGIGNFISKVGGEGEAVELNNGNSTATFYTPSETRSSYTSSLNLGLKFPITTNQAVRFDLNIMRFLSSKRSLNYLLSYNLLTWGSF